MTDFRPSVALIGAGAMGGAMLRGWLEAGAIDVDGSALFDPAPPQEIADLADARGLAVNPASGAQSLCVDVLVCAVKPQAAADALPAYAALAADAVVVSVMAGKSVARISALLGGAPRIVRAMPNLPASVGRGVSGLYAGEAVTASQRDVVERLMRAAGGTVWVDSEAAIDAVTAISGSGPAYIFLMVEALSEAGEALGLPRDAAETLARAAAAGAGALLDADRRSAAQMREAVTSPGGTTAAALKVLDAGDAPLRRLMKEATAAAARRAGELTE